MGVVDATTVGVERADHLEEAPLSAGRLGGGMERRRTRVLAGHGEVAEDETARLLPQASPGPGATGATEVGVDDQPLLPLSAGVIARPDGRDRGAAQVRHR